MEIEDIIAYNLMQLRKKKGLTQEDLGNELGYTFQAVSRWETGKSIPNAANLKRIANYYGVSIDYLFSKQDIVITPEEEKKLNKREKVIKISMITMLTLFVFGIVGMIIGCFNANGLTGFLWASLGLLVIALIITYLYKLKRFQLLSQSLLLWDFAFCLYFQFNSFQNMMMVFFFAVFGQIFLILLHLLAKKR